MKYTSPRFRLHYLEHYTLLAKADLLRDTLVVVDDRHEVLALYSYPPERPDPEATELLGLPFPRVYINLPVQSFIFVPTEVLQEDDREAYRVFLAEDQDGQTYTHSLHSFGTTVYYQYDMFLSKKWRHIFPQAGFYADFQTIFHKMQSYIPFRGEMFGANFRDTGVDLYVFRDDQLCFYHGFEVAGADDLHYFLLSLLNMFGVKGRIQRCLVSGLPQGHAYLEVLRRYCLRLEFLMPEHTWKTDRADLLPEIDRLLRY